MDSVANLYIDLPKPVHKLLKGTFMNNSLKSLSKGAICVYEKS